MTRTTNDALGKLTYGIEELLENLQDESNLKTRYISLELKNSCKELRSALAEEPLDQ